MDNRRSTERAFNITTGDILAMIFVFMLFAASPSADRSFILAFFTVLFSMFWFKQAIFCKILFVNKTRRITEKLGVSVIRHIHNISKHGSLHVVLTRKHIDEGLSEEEKKENIKKNGTVVKIQIYEREGETFIPIEIASLPAKSQKYINKQLMLFHKRMLNLAYKSVNNNSGSTLILVIYMGILLTADLWMKQLG